MNWSYTSTPEGFFYAINRSQYWGTLADQLQGTVGKLMGVPPAEKPKGPKSPDEETAMQSFMGFCKVYWKVMVQNFSPIPIVLVLLTFALFWRLPREQRIWFYLLVIAFCLSAFLQPLSWNNGYDNAGWDMQYQYVSLGYAFFLSLIHILVFIFALGMSNHHTTLALAFLPLLVILLLHAELFWE